MPLATPKPSGEWHAAISPQARRIFGAGPAIAGENMRAPSAPAVAATPTAPAALRTLRREMLAGFSDFVMAGSLCLLRVEVSAVRRPCGLAPSPTRRRRRRGPVRDRR